MEEYEREHARRIRRLGAECTLFLKRNGDFPLTEAGNIALFGSGARRTVKGGTGSGEVNSRYFVTAEQGLEDAGFTVTTKYWLETYDALYRGARERFVRELKEKARREHKIAAAEYFGAVMPEPEYSIPLYGEGDTAVYVLARISGEGSDRAAVPGDILLTEAEKRDILALRKKYRRFLLVLNVGGPVDLSPVLEVENILLLSQLGAETGNILADILLGKSFPAGKLSTTWAAWGEYPEIGEFGGRDETRYREGVFVGYRYFDSVDKKPLFPFGFGLGYTDFEIKAGALYRDGEDILLRASVRNIGAFPGKETVQLYVSQPGEEIPQPWQVLAAFAKTKELQPGESCEVALRFCLRDLAYFDEDDNTWTLEKGSYLLRLGDSSRDTRLAGKLLLNKDAVTVQCRACGGKPDFKDWSPAPRQREKTGMLIGSADALIARATIAHDGDEGAAHTGIAGQGGLGEDAREDGVAEDAVAQRPVHGLAQAVTVIVLERFLGGFEVVVAGLEDEIDLVERGCHGEVIDQAQVQCDIVIAVVAGNAVGHIVDEHDGVIIGGAHKAGVRTLNDGAGGVSAALADGFDIELVAAVLFQVDNDAVLVDEALALFHGLGGDVLEHLELVLALTDDGAQCDGDGQAYHAGAGDAHTHGVLQDVGTQQDGDFLRTAAQHLGGAAHTQGHCHGLGTSHGRNHLAFHQRDNLFSNLLFNHFSICS